jgi:hypothetical protein
MLKVQFDGDVLGVRSEGPITREGVTTLTRTLPGFASVGAFADYPRFIADHHARCGSRTGHTHLWDRGMSPNKLADNGAA